MSSDSEFRGSWPAKASRHTHVVAGITVAVVALAGIVILLVTGGERAAVGDHAGDIEYVEGSSRPRPEGGDTRLAASIADLTEAEIVREGSDLVFTASVAAPIPARLERASLEFRWDIVAEGRDWIVSVKLDKGVQASVLDPVSGFGAGTIDGTLDASVMPTERKIEFRLDPAMIEGFPTNFEWTLSTVLTAFRRDPGSPRAEDRYPDKGTVAFRD